MTNLHQLKATTWRSYRDHRLLWRHFNLSTALTGCSLNCREVNELNGKRTSELLLLLLFADGGGQNGADSAWMQADSPFSSNPKPVKKATPSAAAKKDDVNVDTPRCPHVTRGSTSCAAGPPADHIHCRSDDDCTSFSGRKCCHDGCRLACLVAEPPPPCTICGRCWSVLDY